MPASGAPTKPSSRKKTRSIVVEPPAPVLDERDRRQHTRRPTEHSAKLFCPKSGRFLSGRTRNISAGGILVEIGAPGWLSAGDAVQLTIAFGDRFIVPMSDLVAGTIIRTRQTDNPEIQTLAIAYDNCADSAIAG